jgi:hypothetical protein
VSQSTIRSSFRLLICLVSVLLIAVSVAACGDEEEAQSLTFTLSDDGKAAKLSGPESAETGLAEITLENESKGDGDLQLIRVEGDHSAEDVVKGLGAAMQGKAFPEWFFAAGGVGATASGESQTVTQVLQPGTYYAFDTESTPDAASVPAIDVSGEDSSEVVEADDSVEAFDYGFEAETLPSGEVELAFDNTGDEPHHLLTAPLLDDNTVEDVERSFKSEKGKLPFDENAVQATSVIEGGEGQLLTLDLEPGRYVMLCFISDRDGGPPHALKGMVEEVEVE